VRERGREFVSALVNVCVCVCKRESERVRVRVSEGERERVCQWVGERERQS
jgi:hypothetical protein